MKYIDAEKLKGKIASISLIPQTSADYNDGRGDMKMMVLDIIDSLQQEQLKVDLVEEMEAKDLMQFDWVCLEDDPTPRQVDFIRSGEVGLYWNKIVTPPYIKPIPLTPEILKKNGFTYFTGLWYFQTEERIPIQICFEDNDIISMSIKCNPVSINLKYVHQLQHVLRLCGIKKEIML